MNGFSCRIVFMTTLIARMNGNECVPFDSWLFALNVLFSHCTRTEKKMALLKVRRQFVSLMSVDAIQCSHHKTPRIDSSTSIQCHCLRLRIITVVSNKTNFYTALLWTKAYDFQCAQRFSHWKKAQCERVRKSKQDEHEIKSDKRCHG